MEKESLITKEEIRSLLYYQGAVDQIESDVSRQNLKEFYKIPNAYETINMLLFPGIENEKSRLKVEERQIDEKILDNPEELLNVYENLYSAMCKYTIYHSEHQSEYSSEETVFTYRDDRKHTYLCMQNGENDSFLSTSKMADRESLANGAANYFQKKDGLVLMDIEAQNTLEHIDLNDVLGELSAFPEEEEILYPPFQYLSTEKMQLTEKERKLKDYHGNPPYGKFRVVLKGSTVVPKNLTQKEWANLRKTREELTAQEGIAHVKSAWRAIRTGEESNHSQELEQYVQWKKKLKLYLRGIYAQIKYDVMCHVQDSQKDMQREKMFCEDLNERIEDANEKREQYEKQLQIIHLAEIIIGGIAGFFLSLTMIGMDVIAVCQVEFICKVLFLLAVTVCIILTAIGKSMSLQEKLQQRTKAYLAYDTLLRDWTYERDKSEESLEHYIRRMRQIEEQDNQRCIQYTDHKIQEMSDWEEKIGKMKDELK